MPVHASQNNISKRKLVKSVTKIVSALSNLSNTIEKSKACPKKVLHMIFLGTYPRYAQ